MQCVDTDTVWDAVGLIDGEIYMTLGCCAVSIHDTLLCNDMKSNCTVTIHHRLRGWSNMDVSAGQWKYGADMLSVW